MRHHLTFLILFTVSLFASNLKAAHQLCSSETVAQLAKQIDEINNSYLERSGGTSGIKPKNSPQVKIGAGEGAVILFHGFMASPFEVQGVANQLAKAGYSVYLPLIPAFGSSAKVANTSSITEWREAARNAVKTIGSCFKKIALVGFSLGGGLTADFILNSYLTHPEDFAGIEITSVTLLSPYVKPKARLARILNKLTRLASDTIGVDTLYWLTGEQDLKAPLQYPEFYNDKMPLVATSRIFDFSDDILKTRQALRSNVPVLLMYSEADGTVDITAASTFVGKHFTNIEEYSYPWHLRIPHQITLTSANSSATNLYKRVRGFIQNHFGDFTSPEQQPLD